MLTYIAAVIAGLGILIWSADKFVDGAAALARLLGVSTLIIGIIIVGFGTSAPEIGVSIIAVLEGTPNIAIGNALGSNIANIGLILGITAILSPIAIDSRLLKTEFPLLLLATAVMAVCLIDLQVNQFDGLVLLGVLILALFLLIRLHRRQPIEVKTLADENVELAEGMTLAVAIGWLVFGLVLLVGSSKLLVWGASQIALEFGISELIIGLTIVALGTSLPELAASIASLKKNVADVAIGNVIGSNLFNSLAVVGIPALMSPFSIDPSARSRDLPIAIGLTLLLVLMARFPTALPRHISRRKGIALFAAFVIYQLYLYYKVAIG